MDLESEKLERIELVSKLLNLLTLSVPNTHGIGLVFLPTLQKLLDRLPLKVIEDLEVGLKQSLPTAATKERHHLEKSMPDIHSDEWVIWFVKTRDVLKIERTSLLENCEGIDKHDLANFENGKRPFKYKRRAKLLAALNKCLASS